MNKFVAGHVTKCDFLKIVNSFFLNTNFALKLQEKCWKDNVLTFKVHLSVTIKSLTRYKQKVVFGGDYKSYYFAEKLKCRKISPLNVFPLKFRV